MNARRRRRRLCCCCLLLLASCVSAIGAFVPSKASVLVVGSSSSCKPNHDTNGGLSRWSTCTTPDLRTVQQQQRPHLLSRQSLSSLTQLSMYGLPEDGNNNNNNNKLPDEWLGTALTLVGTVAFFLSPVGALVLSLFNSLLILAITIPLVAFLGLQLWQYTNTISGDCPNCGAPVQVLKTTQPKDTTTTTTTTTTTVGGMVQPSLCLTCGSVVQASSDNARIELSSSIGDGHHPNNNTPNTRNDATPFGWGRTTVSRATRRTTSSSNNNSQGDDKDKVRRERTIIDVPVEYEE